MNPYLILLQKGKHYLLVRYPDRLHLITVDRKLTNEKEEWLLGGTYSDAALEEAGLTRETFRLSDLRGVAVSGPETGETVTLYIGKKKHTWQLSDDSTESDLNALFEGIERFQAPQSRKDRDWRRSLQNAASMDFFLILGNALNVVAFISAFCVIFRMKFGMLLPILNAVLMVLSLGLYLVFPQYYTILEKKEYQKAGYTARVCHLGFAMILAPLVLGLDTMRSYAFLEWGPVLVICVTAGVLTAVLVNHFSRELSSSVVYTLVLALMLIFGAFGLVGHVNHMLNPNTTQTQRCVVQEKDESRSRRGGTSYSCTVTLENGVEVDLNISREDYERMGQGDWVEVYAGPGAIGIEYAYFVSWISRG